MSDRTIASKSERKNYIIREMTGILQADKNGAASARYKELNTELETLEETLRMLTRIERGMASKPVAPAVNVNVPETITTASERNAVQTASERAHVNRQIRTLLTTGRVTSELRDIVGGTDAQGQALLALLYSPEWTSAMRGYAPIASQLSVTHAETSAPMKVAAFSDVNSMALYLDPENTNSASFLSLETDPANIYSTTSAATDALVTSLVLSKQFAASGIPNLEQWLQKTLFSRIARSLELSLLSGIASYWNGSTVTTTALPNVQGIIPALMANGSSSVGVSAVSYADSISITTFLDLLGSLDSAYQLNAIFLVSKNSYSAMLSQLNGIGEPLFKLDENGIMRIAGKPVYPTSSNVASAGAGKQLSDYSTAASGAPFILAGDFSLAGHWIDGGGPKLKVLTERASDVLDNIALAYSNISSVSTVTNLSVKSATSAGA